MKADGLWRCFNCQGKRVDENQKPFPLRKLEIRKVNPHNKNKKKKGKVIAEAMVCTSCYDDGFNQMPVGFRGYMKIAKPKLKPEMLKMLQQQKEHAEKKVEKAKAAGIA